MATDFNSSFYRKSFAVLALGLVGYGLMRVLEPFWGALAWGGVLRFHRTSGAGAADAQAARP